jgi:DoxX-like family
VSIRPPAVRLTDGSKQLKHTRDRRHSDIRIEQMQGDQSIFSFESIGDKAMKSIEYKETRIKNYALWTVQWLLALLFLWAGGVKLVLPLEMLKGPVALPGLFVRFIGVAEALGAIGLILPWLLRIRPVLTPLAAAGLVIIMIGATVVTLMGGGGAFALFPATVGILAASVAYRRWRAVPYRRSVDFQKADSGLRALSSEA